MTFTKRDIDIALKDEKTSALIAYLKENVTSLGKLKIKGFSQEQRMYDMDSTYKQIRDMVIDESIGDARNRAYRKYLAQVITIREFLQQEMV